MARQKSAKPKSGGTLRIIGGDWRGRKLPFPDGQGLRPTGDRVRETLFNWLMYDVHGTRCLDAFAGSGALGLEALSRGAAFCQYFETNSQAVKQLKDNLSLLNCKQADVSSISALQGLSQSANEPFNLVFLDPPFHKDLLAPCIELLCSNGWLAPGSKIYIEAERELKLSLNNSFSILKHKQTGMVQSWLLEFN